KVIMAAESSVDAYIIKPFRSQMLKDKIDKILQLSVHGPAKEAVVVDDDDDARAMIMEYLKQLGFKNIHSFTGAKEALSHLQQSRDMVGLIVSDWEMPDMNGLELLKACKQSQALAEIPFLMITSQSSVERMKVLQAAKA